MWLATSSPPAASHPARRAFKDNIDLEPVRFTYKADASGDLQLGFIVEDVPELVSIPCRKGVAPMDLVALLTSVVQQQQGRIEALEERLESLGK